jgi:heme exporter protein C
MAWPSRLRSATWAMCNGSMYVHVPTAWCAMLVLTFSAICASAYLITGRLKWDHRLEAAIEMSVVLCLLLSLQGAIWAKPTWGSKFEFRIKN